MVTGESRAGEFPMRNYLVLLKNGEKKTEGAKSVFLFKSLVQDKARNAFI
jgi:hypothetical protein